MYFQDLILTLQKYWKERGCLLTQPYDVEKGAGTFNPATFLRSLGPEPFSAAYPEPCRRPTDGRYGDNPIRLQHYYQFQVVLKPSPVDIVQQYFGSLRAIGITPEDHDLRLVHDDWESPTLGAWGLGWEVWADGMEVTQFTYFQQVGGIELKPIMGEITYGLERLCMFLQGVDNVYQLAYNEQFTYGDIFHQNEVQGSTHNFQLADVAMHTEFFRAYEAECQRLCDARNPVAAADYCLKASHSFNLLDARGAISVNERQNYILRVRTLARAVAHAWLANREELGFPLIARDRLEEPPAAPAPVAAVEIAAERAPLLLELGVEEMPAQVFRSLLEQLPRLFAKHIEPLGLEARDVAFFVTPRRLAISVGSIATAQPDQTLELKGPPLAIARDADGNWTKAALGFARTNNVDVDSLQVRDVKGKDYLFAVVEQQGRGAAELLAEAVPTLFGAIHWYKTMRWHRGEMQGFVRPVQWLVARLGDVALPIEFAGVVGSAKSRGHRFLAPALVTVPADRAGYLAALRDAYVIADHEERRERIRTAVAEVAAEQGLEWVVDEALLAEVTNLVEYPVPVLGGFEESFLQIPAPVLISEMREHQKYLALRRPDGQLSNHFVAISNMVCDDMDLVRKGYEKVLRSRFADARFFLREDLKRPLADRVPDLGNAVYQEKLGSILDKVGRMEKLAARIAGEVDCAAAAVADIARLCKADLTTGMVGEFPDLQGEVGRYYAVQEGLPTIVADGIRDHYLPRNVDDEYPGSAEAAVVALADRLDSLVGIFGIGKAPTSSADPFALRRACITSVAIIVNRGFRLDLRALLAEAIAIHGDLLEVPADALLEQILDFVLTRVTVLFQDQSRPGIPGGFAADTIAAVVQANAAWYDVADLAHRLEAMHSFRQRDDFTDVAATFKRCNNILGDETPGGTVDPALFAHDEETALLTAIDETTGVIDRHLAANDYVAALTAVAPLRETANRFFDAVLVNAEDEAVRANRHHLVGRVVELVRRVADFAAIQEG